MIGLIVPSDFIDPDLYLSASDQAKQSPWTFGKPISPVFNVPGLMVAF